MWKDPVQPVADAATLEQTRQDGQAANKLSLQHQLDLFCRKAVSEAMQQLKADQVHTLMCLYALTASDVMGYFCMQGVLTARVFCE